MRIALASIHPRSLSGQVEGLVGLAQALQKQGHAVTVVSAFPTGQLLAPDRAQLAARTHRVFVDQPLRMARILVRLIQCSHAVDVIQLNLPTPAFSVLADLLQTAVRVPVIVGYEAHLVNVRQLLRTAHLREAPDFYAPRLAINNRLTAQFTTLRAARYIVGSQYQKNELKSLGVGPNRIEVLPTILPSDKLVRTPRAAARALFPGGRLVTFIGHYNHVKGVDVLIHAFETLVPRFPDLRLALAWSGVGRSRLVQQALASPIIEGRVLQLGQVRVPDLLAASDVVVLPYRQTIGQAAQPAALIEALAANVPVVTSDLAPLRELTEGGKTALLVPPDDHVRLGAAIERTLNEPLLAQQMRDAQERWVQQIQPEHVVKEYERVYGQVIELQAGVLCPTGGRAHLQ